MENSGQIMLLDMDGSLFDYNGHIVESLKAIAGPDAQLLWRSNRFWGKVGVLTLLMSGCIFIRRLLYHRILAYFQIQHFR